MIEYKDGDLYIGGDRITSMYGKKITKITRVRDVDSQHWIYYFIFGDEFASMREKELYDQVYMMGVNESRPRGHSHDKLKVPRLYDSGDVKVEFVEPECVHMLCEYCGQTNSFEEGCCNFCGGYYPSENERDMPSLDIDLALNDSDGTVLSIRGNEDKTWNELTNNWKMR